MTKVLWKICSESIGILGKLEVLREKVAQGGSEKDLFLCYACELEGRKVKSEPLT